MADQLFDNQTTPTTPAGSKSIPYFDVTTKKFAHMDDGGIVRAGTLSKNASTAQQTGFAADTYLTNSGIVIPSCGMQVGQIYRWEFGVTKTAAGTAAIVLTARIGAAQTTGDTARAAMTQTIAQAATASFAKFFASLLVRSVSATGVVVGEFSPCSSQASFGDGKSVVSSTFDNTALAGQFVGLSLNGGASAAYTIDSVIGYLTS